MRRGIQGRDNSICKGLEARESLVHLAKSEVQLDWHIAWVPGAMQDGAGEAEAGAGSGGPGNNEPPFPRK